MSSYPLNINNFIDTVYDPEKDPENGPYIESENLFEISNEYYVYYNAYEIGEFLANNESRYEFVMKYFHIDGYSDNQTIINNLLYYGQDVFTWWSVKKNVIVNLQSRDQCHKVHWLNSCKLNLYTTYYNRFYETYFDRLIVKMTNGMFHTTHSFVDEYTNKFNDEDGELMAQFREFFFLRKSTYYSIEEIEQYLLQMLYNYGCDTK